MLVRFEQVMLTLRRFVAQVEESCMDPTLMHSPRGELEEPRTTNDLATRCKALWV
jgi:hypothetical protein